MVQSESFEPSPPLEKQLRTEAWVTPCSGNLQSYSPRSSKWSQIVTAFVLDQLPREGTSETEALPALPHCSFAQMGTLSPRAAYVQVCQLLLWCSLHQIGLNPASSFGNLLLGRRPMPRRRAVFKALPRLGKFNVGHGGRDNTSVLS